jgi:hypothetical protein
MGSTGRPLPALASIGAREGENYAQVRKRMLAAGFTPAQFAIRDCSPYAETLGGECYDRPEVLQCSGSGQGYCNAYWTDGTRVLSITPGEGPNGYLAAATVIDAKNFARGLEEEGNELTGPAVTAFRRAGAVVQSKPKLTAAWLDGTWGDISHGGIPDCDTDIVTTFHTDGSYETIGSTGRFELENGRVTYYPQSPMDVSEPEELTAFDKTPFTTRIQIINRSTIREDDNVKGRCRQ